jgi:amino-acid N-acetyltransferase
MDAPLTVRRAAVTDQAAIVRMVRAERLNPNALHWLNFVVAECEGRVVGAVQMRFHADGSRELGSLVVDPTHRRRGVGARLIGALLAENDRRAVVHVITQRTRVPYFAAWGFRAIAARRAPGAVRSNHLMGQLVGGLMSLLHRRLPRRLCVLARA